MDAWFLAYLIGLCGLPAQPPLLDPLVLLVLPDRAVSSQATQVSSLAAAIPAIADATTSIPGVLGQVTERPVLADPTSESEVVPGQASSGKVSKAEIAEIVRRKSEPIRHCYELGLAEDEHYGGTVEVGWKIQMDGRVSSVNVVGASKRNPAAEDCLRAEIMRWEFPPSSEPIVVGVYPFVFDASLLSRRAVPQKPIPAP